MVNAATEIRLEVGGSSITLTPSCITIESGQVTVKGTRIDLNPDSALSPASPQAGPPLTGQGSLMPISPIKLPE
ncbi:MAG: hypothetical protein NTX45_16055 [Proteobacteria bacterium]|nr:hypothetical protein [Pseudomonadota bacterium]